MEPGGHKILLLYAKIGLLRCSKELYKKHINFGLITTNDMKMY